MINLITAEIRRLLSRRMTLLFPLGLAILIIGGFVIAFFVINANDSSTIDFVEESGGADASSVLDVVSFLIPVMAFVIGASSIGADLKTGMVEQILTWEPRRLRFLLARCIAVFIGVALAAIFVAVVFIAGMLAVSALAGTTDGATGEFWGNVAIATLRTGLAAGLFGVFGVGVSLLVNSSVGAIVGFVIYFFIIENLFQAFLPKVSVYLPVINTSAFAAAADVERVVGSVFVAEVETVVAHGYGTAGLIVAAYALGAAALAGLAFQRRDVQ